MVLALPGHPLNAVESLDRPHPPGAVESTEVLHAVCPSGTVDRAGQAPGCRSCPSFTSFFDPDGASERASREGAADHSVEAFTLEDVIFGHFTAPHTNELAASFSGCEPHSYNFGGTVLLQQTTAGWVRTQYAPAVISKNCRGYTHCLVDAKFSSVSRSLEHKTPYFRGYMTTISVNRTRRNVMPW